MEDKEKLILGLAIVVLIIAVAISLPGASNKQNNTATVNPIEVEGKKIIYDTIRFGYDVDNYTYGFSENVNGYEQQFLLIKNGDDYYVKIDDQIGLKEIYFVGNQTFLCVDYAGRKECSETTNINDSRLAKYYTYLKSRFFDKQMIEKESAMFDNLFTKKYVVIKNVSDSTIDGVKCRLVEYAIDYNNMSVSEAASYGISLDMPKHFDWEICQTPKLPIYKSFVYTYKGVEYDYTLKAKELSEAREIAKPENLSEGAYSLLIDEMQAQGSLSNCFSMNTTEKEKCISKTAFEYAMPELCKLAGNQSDACIVRLVPFVKDEGLCAEVKSTDFKDDCYIEMAGATKNSSYCEKVRAEAKVEQCLEAAKIKNETTETTTGFNNSSANTTNTTNETAATNETGITNESNTSGNASGSESNKSNEIAKKILEQLEKEENTS